MSVLKDWLTENDGKSWCPSRAIILAAFIVVTVKFIPADFVNGIVGYAGAVTAFVSAVAVNKFSEKKNDAGN